MRTDYIVKDEYINEFYGSTAQEVVNDYQENGIPAEDLKQLRAEWGESLDKMLIQK